MPKKVTQLDPANLAAVTDATLFYAVQPEQTPRDRRVSPQGLVSMLTDPALTMPDITEQSGITVPGRSSTEVGLVDLSNLVSRASRTLIQTSESITVDLSQYLGDVEVYVPSSATQNVTVTLNNNIRVGAIVRVYNQSNYSVLLSGSLGVPESLHPGVYVDIVRYPTGYVMQFGATNMVASGLSASSSFKAVDGVSGSFLHSSVEVVSGMQSAVYANSSRFDLELQFGATAGLGALLADNTAGVAFRMPTSELGANPLYQRVADSSSIRNLLGICTVGRLFASSYPVLGRHTSRVLSVKISNYLGLTISVEDTSDGYSWGYLYSALDCEPGTPVLFDIKVSGSY